MTATHRLRDTGWNRTLRWAGRLGALVGAGVLLLTASTASAQQRVLSCRGSNYVMHPTANPTASNHAYSVLSLMNPNDSVPIYIHRIVVFDRDGNKKCDFVGSIAGASRLAAQGGFTLTQPLLPHKMLNLSTRGSDLGRCLDVPVATADDIKGTLGILVYWSFPTGATGVPLDAVVGTHITDGATGLIHARSVAECRAR